MRVIKFLLFIAILTACSKKRNCTSCHVSLQHEEAGVVKTISVTDEIVCDDIEDFKARNHKDSGYSYYVLNTGEMHRAMYIKRGYCDSL